MTETQTLAAARSFVAKKIKINEAIAAGVAGGSLDPRVAEAVARELRQVAETLGPGTPSTSATYLTVSELAAAIGQTQGAARRLLDGGAIPGARRKTPGLQNSPWLIPTDAPQRYLEQFD